MVQKYVRVRHAGTGRFGAAMVVKAGSDLFMMKTIDVGRFQLKDTSDLLAQVVELSQVRHPNLVAMCECFVESGVLCIISDYLSGGSVASFIDKAKPSSAIPEAVATSWLAEAHLGLAHLHRCGHSHGSLRAARLLLQDGKVQLAGAVVSTLSRCANEGWPPLDELRYWAPERVAGAEPAPPTCAGDVWSMGVILYEVLTLSAPFRERQYRPRLVNQITTGAPPLPDIQRADLSRLCQDLLRLDPEHRPEASSVLARPFLQARLVELACRPSSSCPAGDLQARPNRIGPRALAVGKPRTRVTGALECGVRAQQDCRLPPVQQAPRAQLLRRPPPVLFNLLPPVPGTSRDFDREVSEIVAATVVKAVDDAVSVEVERCAKVAQSSMDVSYVAASALETVYLTCTGLLPPGTVI